MKTRHRLVLCSLLALTVASCAAKSPEPDPTAGTSEVVAFVDVTVVPMDSERLLTDQTVVVADGHITAMGDAATTEIPAGAVRIDASGRFLIPALADMHIHLEGMAWNMMFPPDGQFTEEDLDYDELLFPYVANGIGTVQVMSALPEHIGVRERIDSGEIMGPRLVLARMIDGPERAWPPPISTWVGSPEEARQAVLDAHETGYDRMKVYSFLDRASYEAILATAAEVRMGVGGHIPIELSLEEVLAAGQDLIAHSEELIKTAQGPYDQDQIEAVARTIAEGEAWITPTLTTSRNVIAVLEDFERELERPEMRYLHPMDRGIWSFINGNLYQPIPEDHRTAIRDGFQNFQRPLVRALSQTGGRLMTGTDALIPSTVPGFSIHDELAELVEAGLSPYEALYSSTTEPFAFLEEIERSGTIEVGKQADLVLLRNDPLADIAATRDISGVMIRGRWIDRQEIDDRLEDLAAGYR